MKLFYSLSAVVVLVLLALIAYSTSLGKLLPAKHVDEVSCDSVLTRSLFFSTFLGQQDDLKYLAKKVKAAETIKEINQLVSSESNIDATRTLWFKSNKDPSSCQVQIFLQHPAKDGNNSAFVGFQVEGFIPTGASAKGNSAYQSVLEYVNLQWQGIKWFKE
jgi:hypothetical protein